MGGVLNAGNTCWGRRITAVCLSSLSGSSTVTNFGTTNITYIAKNDALISIFCIGNETAAMRIRVNGFDIFRDSIVGEFVFSFYAIRGSSITTSGSTEITRVVEKTLGT